MCLVIAGGAGQQKTHDRCQPWVLVKSRLTRNKHPRRRRLRRRPKLELAARLASCGAQTRRAALVRSSADLGEMAGGGAFQVLSTVHSAATNPKPEIRNPEEIRNPNLCRLASVANPSGSESGELRRSQPFVSSQCGDQTAARPPFGIRHSEAFSEPRSRGR